jgi:hypothetical protein
MITDRNEAVRHNSCKKLAQLGKVIFTMAAQARDRHADCINLQDEYHTAILQLVERHQENAEEISKTLVQFRKSCVDNSCREWGLLYKQIKSTLTTLTQQTKAKLSVFMTDAQNFQKSIKDMQESALHGSAKVAASANDVFKDLKSKSWSTTADVRSFRATIQPILDRTESYRVQSEENMRLRKADYAKAISQKRSEITKFVRLALEQHRGPFLAIGTHLAELEGECQAYGKEYAKISAERNVFIQKQKVKRNQILSQTRDQWKDLREQIRSLKVRQKLGEQSHSVEAGDLIRALKVAKVNDRSAIDALDQEIHSQEIEGRKYADSHHIEMQKLEIRDEAAN